MFIQSSVTRLKVLKLYE